MSVVIQLIPNQSNRRYSDTFHYKAFSLRSGRIYDMHFLRTFAKLPNLELETQPETLLGLLPFSFTLSVCGV